MKRTITIIALMGLAACGGGRVDVVAGAGAGPLSSAPGEAALVNYLQAAHQYTLNATDSLGNNYTFQINSQPNAATSTFNGEAPAYSTVDTFTLEQNGVLIANSISTSYYLLNPYVPLGKTFGTGTPFGLVTSYTPFPTTLSVGNTGPLDSLTYYHDSTLAIIDANETDSYSVDANNSTTLLMCLNFVVSHVTAVGTADDLDGFTPNLTETDCYSVDASGTAALVSVALTVGDEALNFK
ncbi:MAG: hypothetical protein ACLPSY_06580 [Steroidobacteraceae bacterium]